MKYKPLFDLYVKVNSQDQADDVSAILERYNMRRQYGESEIGKTALMKAERKPYFENIVIVKEEGNGTMTKSLYGLWPYRDIYNTMIDQAGVENVKISNGDIPYDQAFKRELEHIHQHLKDVESRKRTANEKAAEVDAIDDLYNALRRSGHKHAFALTYIRDRELDRIGTNLELIHADLQLIASRINATEVSDFQRDLIEEQREQM